jgi:outer membrane protein OmpA-like peptidoglycan-associated protein
LSGINLKLLAISQFFATGGRYIVAFSGLFFHILLTLLWVECKSTFFTTNLMDSKGKLRMKNKCPRFSVITHALALIVTLSLIGCTTTNPFTGEQEVNKTSQGAMWGALGGALLGAAIADKKDRKDRMLKGAGIGAIAGGSVGLYMDKQEDKLRQQLQGTGVSVTRDGDNIILNMPSNITFDTDSFAIKNRFHDTLNSVVLVLNEYKSTMITVIGHTDSTGSEQYNQKLSQQRAISVANYLTNQGVAQERLAAIGYGEAFPIAPNNTAQGRAQNRRVELQLEPVTQ